MKVLVNLVSDSDNTKLTDASFEKRVVLIQKIL